MMLMLSFCKSIWIRSLYGAGKFGFLFNIVKCKGMSFHRQGTQIIFYYNIDNLIIDLAQHNIVIFLIMELIICVFGIEACIFIIIGTNIYIKE